MFTSRFTVRAACTLAATLLAVPVLAGPPLLCFPFDIAGAKSLPVVGRGYGDVDPQYDTSRLVADTVELLSPKAPIIVHMETLRRATLYARHDTQLGAALLAKLRERAGVSNVSAPIAVFDFGYLVETFRQSEVPVGAEIDGYALVKKAIALQGDPEMEFAAAVITIWPKRADYDDHVRNAKAGAAKNPLLATNLQGHLPANSQP